MSRVRPSCPAPMSKTGARHSPGPVSFVDRGAEHGCTLALGRVPWPEELRHDSLPYRPRHRLQEVSYLLVLSRQVRHRRPEGRGEASAEDQGQGRPQGLKRGLGSAFAGVTFGGRPTRVVPPPLHLDEDKRRAVEGDEVDLPVPEANISLQDAKTIFFE